MKKFFLTIFTIFLFVINLNYVSASTNTFERTNDNYRIPSDIKVTDENKYLILKTSSVDETEKVYDFANLLKDNDEENLYNSIKKFIEQTNFDLAIVTIDDNNKGSSGAYADDFFDYNNFGISSSRDGALILIDMDKREIYISTSGEAIKMYDDLRIDSIIDAGFNELKNAKYYECLNNMIEKLSDYFNKGVPKSNQNMIINNDGSVSIIKKIPYLFVAFMSLTVSIIISLIMYFKTLSKIKKHDTVTYLNPKLSNLTKDDKFVSTHTSKIRRETSSSGHSSGSSSHSSSSGRSHGGGGRHF